MLLHESGIDYIAILIQYLYADRYCVLLNVAVWCTWQGIKSRANMILGMQDFVPCAQLA
jgi:hypothetical protein